MKFTGILLLLVACAARRDAVELRKEGQQHSNFALMGSEIRVYTGTEMDPTRLLGARIGIDGQIARQDVQSPRASAPQTEVGNTDEVALPRVSPGFFVEDEATGKLRPSDADADGLFLRLCMGGKNEAPASGQAPNTALLGYRVPSDQVCQRISGAGTTWYSSLARFAGISGGVKSSLGYLGVGAGADVSAHRSSQVNIWMWFREARSFDPSSSTVSEQCRSKLDGPTGENQVYEVIDKVFVGHAVVRLIELNEKQASAQAEAGIWEAEGNAQVIAQDYKQGTRYMSPIAYTTRWCPQGKKDATSVQAEALGYREMTNLAMIELVARGRDACKGWEGTLKKLQGLAEDGALVALDQLISASAQQEDMKIIGDAYMKGTTTAQERLKSYCSALPSESE